MTGDILKAFIIEKLQIFGQVHGTYIQVTTVRIQDMTRKEGMCVVAAENNTLYA